MFSKNSLHLLALGCLCLIGSPLFAEPAPAKAAANSSAKEQIAAQPPLGWNSWDAYGLRINEQQFRDNASVLAKELKASGYIYAIIDEGWYMANPEDRPTPERLHYAVDQFGRFIPVPVRFPTAQQEGKNTGFTELGSWLHAQGLKFGIHIIRGIPRESVRLNLPIADSAFKAADAADQGDACPWDPTSWGIKDNAAGQAWYDSLIHQYAAWGVDYIKVDCISDHPYRASEIRQLHRAIERSGRPILLSLSPGPTALEHQPELAPLAQMWRTSNDVWDVWSSPENSFPIGIKNQFEITARWAPYAHAGNWPDADMLPLGELRPFPDVGPGARHTRLTESEQHVQLTLWAMARSPLIIGANLTLLDEKTLGMLKNPMLLHINQHALNSRQLMREGDFVAWIAELPEGHRALAVFNLSDTTYKLHRPLTDFAFKAGRHQVRNIWNAEPAASTSSLDAVMSPHSTMLFMVD